MSKRKVDKNQQEGGDKLTRIAIVSSDKCKPKRCRQECKKFCPVVRMGEMFSLRIILKMLCLSIGYTFQLFSNDRL